MLVLQTTSRFHVQVFINNKFVAAKSRKRIPVVDPRTEKTIFEVDEGSLEDVDAAVQAASEAFTKGPWPRTAAAVSQPVSSCSYQSAVACRCKDTRMQ